MHALMLVQKCIDKYISSKTTVRETNGQKFRDTFGVCKFENSL